MRRALKWVGIALTSLIGLIAVVVLVLFLLGRAKLNRIYERPATAALPVSSASVDYGRHVMQIHGCNECHGGDLGGGVFLDIPPGLIVARNLTSGSGGIGASYSDADWDHAIRYGLRPDGSWLLPFMPYRLFSRLSDGDTAALIAYLKSIPAVSRELPRTKLRLPGYVMVGMPGFDLDEMLTQHAGPEGPPTEAGPTAAYGQYLASTTCVECHGKNLQGGKHPAPEAPPAPSLLPAGSWSVDDFARAVREGVVPGGRKLTPWMPFKSFHDLTDVEVEALHRYLQTLRPEHASEGT
jgi:mono/diheme cytochrome c family protein